MIFQKSNWCPIILLAWCIQGCTPTAEPNDLSAAQQAGTVGTPEAKADESDVFRVRTSESEDGGFSANVVGTDLDLMVMGPKSGALADTSLFIPVGSIQIATNITITEGAPLLSSENKSSVGAGNMVEAGPAVLVSSSAFQDPAVPMSLTLNVNPSAGLVQQGTDRLGVLYMAVVYGQEFKIVLGIVPSNQVSLKGNKLVTPAKYFGSYQPVYLSEDIDKAFELVITRDIIAKSGDVVIVNGGDRTPPTPVGELKLIATDHHSATVSFELATDNFSSTLNLSYLAYVSESADMNSLEQVEAAVPVGDFKRKVTALTLSDLQHGKTYYASVVVRDEMSNKAFYPKIAFTTPVPNFAPVISARLPVASEITSSYREPTLFSVTATDANAGEQLSYSWTLNGSSSPFLVASGPNAELTPNAELAGRNVVQVSISDGSNVVATQWTTHINLFSTACNQLQPGHICTLVGNVDIGDGHNPTSDPDKIRITPDAIAKDGDGNLFIADSVLHVVWFYNRSGSSLVRLGQTVAAGEIAIIIGTGAQGASPNGTAARQYALNSPKGLAYDSSREVLYVSSHLGHAVVRFTASGEGRVIMGGLTNNAAGNVEGGPASAHACFNPAGLAIDGANDNLYVACSGSHAIKKIATASGASPVGSIVVGALVSGSTAAATTEGTLGSAGAAKASQPWALRLTAEQILLFSQIGNCQIRAANVTASAYEFFSSAASPITVAANSTGKILGTSCLSGTPGAFASINFNRPLAIDSISASGAMTGLFVASDYSSSVWFINMSVNSRTIGGRVVASNQGQIVLGMGYAGYNGEVNSGSSTRLNYPQVALIHGDKLIVSELYNRRVRSLDIAVSDGDVSLIVGNGRQLNNQNTDTVQPADTVSMGNPSGIAVGDQSLYYSDRYNSRIKKVDLRYGTVKTMAGSFFGDGGFENASTSAFRRIRSLALHDGLLYLADDTEAFGANMTCKVRAINTASTSKSYLDFVVPSGWVADVAGNFELGCNSWSSAYDEGPAADAALRFLGAISVGGTGSVWVTMKEQHCVVQVDAAGVISRKVGSCGSASDTVGSLSGGSVRLSFPATTVEDPVRPGNVFVLDLSSGFTGKLKYANFGASAVTIAGVSVAAGNIATVSTYNTAGVSGLAIYGNEFCVSSGGSTLASTQFHGVVCRSLTTGAETFTVGGNFAGTAKAGRPLGSSAENVAASSASLFNPMSLTFDADGNLYIADHLNFLIRKVASWH